MVVKKTSHLVIITFLVIALPVVIFAALNQTNLFNNASGPGEIPNQAATNLNSTTDTLSSINPDGSMGPSTSYGNWSNSLPAFLKGKLVFQVIDPQPSDPGSQGLEHRPSGIQNATNSGNNSNNGPTDLTALNLTITKVEVHMAYQGAPGAQNPGGNVNHWETLTISSPATVDLVELANTHDFSKLGITSLAAGKYTEIRLYVSLATATVGGQIVDLKIPGKNNIVRVVKPFTVVSGQTTTLTMDFNAQNSVIKAGNTYLLKPVVARLIEEH